MVFAEGEVKDHRSTCFTWNSQTRTVECCRAERSEERPLLRYADAPWIAIRTIGLLASHKEVKWRRHPLLDNEPKLTETGDRPTVQVILRCVADHQEAVRPEKRSRTFSRHAWTCKPSGNDCVEGATRRFCPSEGFRSNTDNGTTAFEFELLKLLPQNGHPLLTAVDEADLRPWQEHHDHQARNTATTAEISDADATDR